MEILTLISLTVASKYSCLSGCLAKTVAPWTRGLSVFISLSLIVVEPRPILKVTLHLTCLSTLRTLASQKAPLYFADTWVPMANAPSPWNGWYRFKLKSFRPKSFNHTPGFYKIKSLRCWTNCYVIIAHQYFYPPFQRIHDLQFCRNYEALISLYFSWIVRSGEVKTG